MMISTETTTNVNSEAGVILVLEQQGSATIEDLMQRLDMSWEQAFSTIDRLSRAGSVRLTRVGLEYYLEKVANA